MKTAALLLLACMAAAGARAQAGDPLKSEGCAAALASLQSARSGGRAAAEVEGMRAAAAAACLGTAVRPSRPSRTVQAPIVVPPPQVEVPPPAAALRVPPPQLPPPPVAIERAPLPAQCDMAGCWTPGETHLRHVPPSLAGPGGLCVQQGGAVYCP
jgi:hypothetical protein